MLANPYLQFAVLPMKKHGRLMFYLCEKCSSNLDPTKECNCTEQERMITGTFTTIELAEAVNKHGYKIVKVYEIYHYKEKTIYNPPYTESLFSEYMQMMFKVKECATGFPDYCDTDQKKDQYIKELETNMGLKVSKQEISKNIGLRQCSKLLLNSLWGKLAQSKRDINVYCKNNEENKFLNLLFDSSKEIKNFIILNENVINVSYEDLNEQNNYYKTQEIIASFITSSARLILYNIIHKIENNPGTDVAYFDTDSIMIKRHKDAPLPDINIGPAMGQFVSELKKNEVIILIFFNYFFFELAP